MDSVTCAPPSEEQGRKGRARDPERRVSLRPAHFLPLLLLVALAAVFAGSAAAFHDNLNCANDTFNHTWEDPSDGDYLITVPIVEMWDDCILIKDNVTVPDRTHVRLHDVRVVFANNITNITINLGNDTIWEMTDLDRDPDTTNDTGRLEIADFSNRTNRGFFFSVAKNVSVYFNDTNIIGGGLPGNNLTWLSGLYFNDLNDFALNRVYHQTFANGLLLVNYSVPTRSLRYNVTGSAGYGVYLNNVGNFTFDDLAVRAMTYGVLINDSRNLTFVWFNSTAISVGMTANRVAGMLVDEAADNTHVNIGFDLNAVSNVTLRHLTLMPAPQIRSGYGVDIDGSRDVAVLDSSISNHGLAGIRIFNLTRNLLVENVTVRGLLGSSGRGVYAPESGTIFAPNNLTFRTLLVSGAYENINFTSVWSASFWNTSVGSTIGSNGLFLSGCSAIRFSDGQIVNSQGIGAVLGGSNLTIERTNITGNAVGIEIGDATFLIESTTVFGNGVSVRTAGPANIGPSTIMNSTIWAGDGVDALSLEAPDGSTFARILLVNNSFRFTGVPKPNVVGLRVTSFDRVEVYGNTFFALPIAVYKTGTLLSSGNTHRVSSAAANAVPILFDSGRSVSVWNETFLALPPPAGLSTVIRAPNLVVLGNFSDMALPPADFGIWVSGDLGSPYDAVVIVHNVSMAARRDAVTVLNINSISVDRVTVSQSTNGLLMTGAGNAQNLSVRDVALQANTTGVSMTADERGRIVATGILFVPSGGLPSRGVVIVGGLNVTLARIGVDGVARGIDITDARRVTLTDQNFTNNAVGLFMDVVNIQGTTLNWTVDTPTLLQNTLVRLTGNISVGNVPFTLDNATISVIAINSERHYTHFYIEGAGPLSILNGSKIITEPASGLKITTSRYTIEMSTAARINLYGPDAAHEVLLEGLGDPASPELSQQGILLHGGTTNVSFVHFVNVYRPLLIIGGNLTVQYCTFEGVGNAKGAVTAWSAATVRMSRVAVYGTDGVEAISAKASIDNSTFAPAGIALVLNNGHGTLSDSVVDVASGVVSAVENSDAIVLRTHISRVADAFFASNCSAIFVEDSNISDFSHVATATDCGSVDLMNTFVGHFKPDGSHDYTVETGSNGHFRASWNLSFAVCALSDGLLKEGALVVVKDALGTLLLDTTTGPALETGNRSFLEYQSHNGVETRHSPMLASGTWGARTNTTQMAVYNATLIVLCVDDVTPTIFISTPMPRGNKTRERDLVFEGNAYDQHSDLDLFSPCIAIATLDGGACKTTPDPGWDVTLPLAEGLNTIRVEAVDLFGNKAVAWFNITLDTIPPAFAWCSPNATEKFGNATVDLTCQIDLSPEDVTFSGIARVTKSLDTATGLLHARLILEPGLNTISLSTVDDVGNIGREPFVLNWTLDLNPPTVVWITAPPKVTDKSLLPASGHVSGDTRSASFNGEPVRLFNNTIDFVVHLTEGMNYGNLTLIDDVGNSVVIPINITLDSTTNCALTTPAPGARTNSKQIVVGGHCDPDVVLTVNGALRSIPAGDGAWSVSLTLAEGVNHINVTGTDTSGTQWYAQVDVTYVPGSTAGDSNILLLFVLLAAGTLVMAFFIMRRPRREEPEEPWHPATGAQKAPPRPKPPTMQLPETPEDMAYRPRVPPPPPKPPGR